MEQRFFFFYIMASRSHNLYCGVTSKLRKRVWEHKTGFYEGFTSRYNIDRLVYYERYDDIRTAINREKQIKRWSRGKKIWLVERVNPAWDDLSDGCYTNADLSTRAGAVVPGPRSR